MSNAVKGEFELPLGGVTYRFKVGVGALMLAQEQIGRETPTSFVLCPHCNKPVPVGGVPRLDEFTTGLDRWRLLYVRAFLWAGLRKYHPEITIDGVTELLEAADEAEAIALVAGLRGSTVPDTRDVEALEDAGARPTVAAATATAPGPRPTPIRSPGVGRSTSRRARPA
jgi:hypothetical protein